MAKNYYGIAAAVFLLGLFPTLFLPVLQLILLIVLVGLFFLLRCIGHQGLRQLLSLRNIAFAQFFIFFLINAVFYPVWESPKTHYRAVALESWSMSLFCVVVLALWLHNQKADHIKRALIHWLPVGLSVSFLIASVVYVSGHQGLRISLFTPNPLVPPFWFLVLAITSFTWFPEMSYRQKIWRLALFFLTGVMAVYGSARLVMLAWAVCGIALVIWMFMQARAKDRPLVLIIACLSVAVCVGGVLLADHFSGGLLIRRMAIFSQVSFNYDSISTQFLRVQIWSSALSIIGENVWTGVGQVNERIALSDEMGMDRWLRAHQTYLSYLIAGGIPALISGLLMQSTVLSFLTHTKRPTLFPAFLGLGVVVTLNCLTDSIFQSAVSVQAFMLITLLFLRASDADQPTLAPQKQVSSAIT